MLATIYHRLMIRVHGWRLHRAVAQFKRAGERAGIPSLDGYSDEAIAEGLRRLRAARPAPPPRQEREP